MSSDKHFMHICMRIQLRKNLSTGTRKLKKYLKQNNVQIVHGQNRNNMSFVSIKKYLAREKRNYPLRNKKVCPLAVFGCRVTIYPAFDF